MLSEEIELSKKPRYWGCTHGMTVRLCQITSVEKSWKFQVAFTETTSLQKGKKFQCVLFYKVCAMLDYTWIYLNKQAPINPLTWQVAHSLLGEDDRFLPSLKLWRVRGKGLYANCAWPWMCNISWGSPKYWLETGEGRGRLAQQLCCIAEVLMAL